MIFHKKRSFGELISDSFQFFKIYGKNYFKNYFTINGGLLILLLVIFIVGFKDLVSQAFSSNLSGQSYYFERYFEQNMGVFIIISIIIIALLFLISIVNYSFPVIYIDKASQSKRNDFSVNEMLSALKSKAGKIFIFFLLSFLILLPMIAIAFGISVLLVIVLIGIPLMIILFPTAAGIVNFTLFDFLITRNDFFTSLKKSFNYMFSKNFWKYIGGIIVIYFIIQIVVSIFTMIPYFILVFSQIVTQTSDSQVFLYLVFSFYLVAILVSFILNNILYVLIGLMYYDSREDLQRDTYFEEIDSIGKNV